ncbi:PQQ-binding-like beta-propeller repeat protein [Nocardia sp. NPDC048505]|uniref:outer membrane protein assembly factor BamB family protein n=1 Tax=unclassified Nocardia TaxID=2637762 RepID=UPI0033D6566D
MIPGLRNLMLAATAAVVTSTAAIVVLTQPEDTTRKITGTSDAAPGLAWSLGAADYGRADAEFRHPREGTALDWGSPGFIEAGATLVTVLGSPDGDYSGLRDPLLVGIDAATGARRWQAPAADLRGCGLTPVDGQIVCYTFEELVGYDVETGTVTRTPVDFLTFALQTFDDRIYLAEGDVESDDVRVHAGTLADPDAYWTQPYEMGALWEDPVSESLDVAHGQGVFTLGGDIAGFDLATGKPTWHERAVGCSDATETLGALVVLPRAACRGDQTEGTAVLDRTGRTLATTESPVAHHLSIDNPTDDTVPLLLADGAHDRRTGARLWTSPDLVTAPRAEYNNTTTGTASAILGDIALLEDSNARTLTGLDLRTGTRLWRTENLRYGGLLAGDGHTALFSDAAGLWALDLHTGTPTWDIPFLAITANRPALTGPGHLTTHGKGNYTYATTHTILRLRPLTH